MDIRPVRYADLPSREQKGRTLARFVRRRIVASVVTVCLFSSQLSALINPKFTPIHLTNQSEVILRLLVKPLTKKGKLPARVVRAVKGEAANRPLILLVRDELLVNVLDEILEGQSLPAMMFIGRYSGSDRASAQLKATGFAFLSLGGRWFALLKEPQSSTWQLVEDTSDMRGAWDGSTEMLFGCVQYILDTPYDAQVPVRAGVSWDTKKRIAKVAGPVRDLMMVDLSGKGQRGLFVVSEAGDRFFAYDQDNKTFKDATKDLGLILKSKSVAFGDFNADGLLDIASCKGRALSIWPQSKQGEFKTGSQRLELDSACQGLKVIDLGTRGRAGLLASTETVPMLIWLTRDGTLLGRGLSSSSKRKKLENKLGSAKACVVADLNRDGWADVLQPFVKGGLFYAGKGGGKFQAPKSCPDVYSGDGEVKIRTGDFDGDGLLDIIVFGKQGLFLWHNRGAGLFVEPGRMGDPDYIAKANMVDGAVCDLNGDGRQEFLAFYSQAGPHPFFSRGFFTFGFAGELDIIKGNVFPQAGAGQQAGLMADVNGDGGQDMILVLPDGMIWVVFQKVAQSPTLAVRVMLRVDKGFSGPICVRGFSAGRSLGAWSVTAGGGQGFFARDRPGPIKLRWQFPAEPVQEEQVILEEGLQGLFLGPSGIVKPSNWP